MTATNTVLSVRDAIARARAADAAEAMARDARYELRLQAELERMIADSDLKDVEGEIVAPNRWQSIDGVVLCAYEDDYGYVLALVRPCPKCGAETKDWFRHGATGLADRMEREGVSAVEHACTARKPPSSDAGQRLLEAFAEFVAYASSK
jgi:hypothetical protein